MELCLKLRMGLYDGFSADMLKETALIPQQVYGGAHKLDELELPMEPIPPESKIAVTLEQSHGAGSGAWQLNRLWQPFLLKSSSPSYLPKAPQLSVYKTFARHAGKPRPRLRAKGSRKTA